MSFPTSPTNGQITVVNAVTYQYNSTNNAWRRILTDVTTSSKAVQTVLTTTNTAHFVTFVDSNNATANAETIYTTASVTINPGTGEVDILSRLVATNTTTGALVVSGGVGIGGSLYVGQEIYASGNITANFSDDRLKNNLGTITNALDKVKELAGFYYEANDLAESLGYKKIKDVGVSAQKVQSVLPEIVTNIPTNPEYLTVKYEKIVPLLIEAIKELEARIKNLENTLTKWVDFKK